MQDGIIKGTGNSRFLKGAGWPNSYAEFKTMAEAGTLPIDLNGLNEAGWQQIGTLLSKANLFSDSTALKYPNCATVDAALGVIGRLNAGLGNEWVWSKGTEQVNLGSAETLNNTAIGSSSASTAQNKITYASDALSLLSNENTTTITTNPSNTTVSVVQAAIRGKYCRLNYHGTSYTCSYLSDTATVFLDSGVMKISTCQNYGAATIESTVNDYVNSSEPNAYPPAVSDGYVYKKMGRVGNKVQMATGSYTGTGTYGSENPNTLTFEFEPKLVFVFGKGDGILPAGSNAWSGGFLYLFGATLTYVTETSYGQVNFTLGGKSLSWYSSGSNPSADRQLNSAGSKYSYLAIG